MDFSIALFLLFFSSFIYRIQRTTAGATASKRIQTVLTRVIQIARICRARRISLSTKSYASKATVLTIPVLRCFAVPATYSTRATSISISLRSPKISTSVAAGHLSTVTTTATTIGIIAARIIVATCLTIVKTRCIAITHIVYQSFLCI